MSEEFKNAINASTQIIEKRIKREACKDKEDFKQTIIQQVENKNKEIVNNLEKKVAMYDQQLQISDSEVEELKRTISDIEEKKQQLTSN